MDNNIFYRNIIGKKLLKIIEENPNIPWDWNAISRNPNITCEIIKSNPNKPWNWLYICYNPNITMELIESNPNKPWDWNAISSNPNITMELIKSNPNKPWNWLCINRNIMKLKSHGPSVSKNIPSLWKYISLDPNIKMELNSPLFYNLKQFIENIENIKISYIKRFNLINYRLKKRVEYCEYSREIMKRIQK